MPVLAVTAVLSYMARTPLQFGIFLLPTQLHGHLSGVLFAPEHHSLLLSDGQAARRVVLAHQMIPSMPRRSPDVCSVLQMRDRHVYGAPLVGLLYEDTSDRSLHATSCIGGLVST